jgi:hypothetical protein
MTNSIHEQAKLVVDGVAIMGWVSALMGFLTHFAGLVAAIASMVWCCIRVYETKTFQQWLKKRKNDAVA